MNIPVFDGLTAYITMPNWEVMLILEILTVAVEVLLVLGWWNLRGGKLRWYEIIILVTVVNIITAAMGLAVADAGHPDYFDSNTTYFDANSIQIPIMVTALIMSGVAAVIMDVQRKLQDEPQKESC